MKTFFMRFTVLFTMIALAFICTFNGYDKAGSAYKAQDPDTVLMDAAVVADLHTRSAINRDENAVLTKLFSGISKSETKLNALVFAGDITNNGTRDEYRCLAAILKRYNKADHLIAATGNHDARGDMDEEDYEENMECYYTFLSLMGVETDKPYWSQDVNGYRFIVLGSEDEEKDRAYITDAQGRTVNFENTIVIMTTNAGSNTKTGTLGFGMSANDQNREKVMKALNDFLRPEFLNRVDEIVYFNQLSEDNFKDIARLMLNELRGVLAGKGMTLDYDDSVVDYLAGKSYSVTYGARNLRRTIQKEIEDRIAAAIVDEHRGAVSSIRLTAGDDGVKIEAE